MGTGSSVGCCGLSALQFCSRALQSERRAEIAIFHTGGPALRTDQPTATLCLHSWSGTTHAGKAVDQSCPVREPVRHALVPVSPHIHRQGKGLIENVWRGH